MLTAGDHAAANVRAERARRRWSQRELAERLGWSPSRLGRVEAGQQRIDIDMAVELCTVLGVGLLDLLRGAPPEALRALGMPTGG